MTSARISLDGQVWPAPREELSKRQRKDLVKMDNILSDLTEEFQEIVSVSANFHPKKTSEIYGDRTQMLLRKRNDYRRRFGL